MKIELNVPLKGREKGTIIDIEREQYADRTYWLRRIEDAKIDSCVSIVKDKSVKANETKGRKNK